MTASSNPNLPKDAPVPETAPETLPSLRQSCWLLDQLRIYGLLTTQIHIERTSLLHSTGVYPDPSSFPGLYVESEFAISVRNDLALSDEEEWKYLTTKKIELEKLVHGENGIAEKASRKRSLLVVLKMPGREAVERLKAAEVRVQATGRLRESTRATAKGKKGTRKVGVHKPVVKSEAKRKRMRKVGARKKREEDFDFLGED